MTHLKLLVYFAFLAATSAQAEALPKNILAQLPKGYEVMTSLAGELNHDKLTDYLVVAHKLNEEATYRKTGEGSPRPLYIFTQNSNQTFTLAKTNSAVVFAINQGGQCDPFEDGMEGLVIKNHYFTVQNSVACGQHWNDFATFKYDKKLKNWVFHKRTAQSFNLADTDNGDDEFVENKLHVTKANPKKPILLDQYKP